MPKSFSTNKEQTERANKAIEAFKAKHPNATEADALDAFVAAWGARDAAEDLPASNDVFKSIDAGMAIIRENVTHLARMAATAKAEAEAGVREQMGVRDRRIRELEAALANAADERGDLEGRLSDAEAKLADAEQRLIQNDAMARLLQWADRNPPESA